MASVETSNKDLENSTTEGQENNENVETSKKDEPAVEGFQSKYTFYLTTVGFAVGLGNFWRFPKMVQENGGGTFFVPYSILFFLAGVPLLYTELAIGQRFKVGNVECWKKISKYLLGVGGCSMAVSFFIGVYYNAILSWVIWYMYKTLQSAFQRQPLPWSVCPNTSQVNLVAECASTSPEKYFWYRETLNQTTTMAEFGQVQYHLLACLMVSWFFVGAAMWKGTKSLEKVVKFTTLLPYAVLMIFFGHTCTLEGAWHGVEYLGSPKWDRVFEMKIWVAAATQIFFSLSLGFGGMIGFSAKNTTNSDVETQTWFIAFVNSFTSLLACGIVFGIRGYKARQNYHNCVNESLQVLSSWYPNNATGLTIEDYPDFMIKTYGSVDNGVNTTSLADCSTIDGNLDEVIGGSGLAFVVFAETISEMYAGHLFAFLFFFMLLALGLASMFGNVEGVMNPLKDFWTMWFPNNAFPHRKALTGVIVLSCALSFFCLTGSGVYYVDLFDTFCAAFPLLIIAIIELIGVGWMYSGRYESFEREMLEILPARTWFGHGMSFYMRYTIKFLTPMLLTAVFGYFTFQKVRNGIKYLPYIPNQEAEATSYPAVHLGVGICLTLFTLAPIPGVMVYNYIRTRSKSTDTDSEAIEMTSISQKDEEEK